MIQDIYERLLAAERKWKINGLFLIPSYADVEKVVNELVTQVRRSPTSISVELGGILVKRSDDHIDIYVWAGEAK